MNAARQQPTEKASGFNKQSAILVLALILGIVSFSRTCRILSSSSLRVLDLSVQLAAQDRFPDCILQGANASRLESVLARTVRWTLVSALNVPASLFSPMRRAEYLGERHVLAILLDSGLQVRAPPRNLLS